MNITVKSVALAASMTMASAQVLAQVYGEIGYVSSTYSKTTSTGNTLKSEPAGVVGYIGYDLHENLSVEGSLMVGTGSSDVTLNGATQRTPVSMKFDRVAGIYLKPKMKLMESVEVFGRLGYTEIKGTSSTATSSSTDTLSDWSYGVGANYALNSKTYLTASWMRVYGKDSTKGNGLTVGLGYRF